MYSKLVRVVSERKQSILILLVMVAIFEAIMWGSMNKEKNRLNDKIEIARKGLEKRRDRAYDAYDIYIKQTTSDKITNLTETYLPNMKLTGELGEVKVYKYQDIARILPSISGTKTPIQKIKK